MNAASSFVETPPDVRAMLEELARLGADVAGEAVPATRMLFVRAARARVERAWPLADERAVDHLCFIVQVDRRWSVEGRIVDGQPTSATVYPYLLHDGSFGYTLAGEALAALLVYLRVVLDVEAAA